MLAETNVIPWSCPVPSFGDLLRSRVATLGLNPSNREFVDDCGNELEGPRRRFHTLRSFGLKRWSDAHEEHLEMIVGSCQRYFSTNPYDAWFKRLDYMLSGTKASYYSGSIPACHLDLIPYATACKWTFLTRHQRAALLRSAGDTLAMLLNESRIKLLVLNGKSVVHHFQEISDTHLDAKPMKEWLLPRKSCHGVTGVAYRGVFRHLSGINLRREVMILGFNHNIQSSFGVTKLVIDEIRNWIGQAAEEVML